MKTLINVLLLLLIAFPTYAASFIGNRDDFRDETIYFVMTTRFYDGDKSNNTQCWDGKQYNVGDPAWRGDFKGLIEKLDYIKALGFTEEKARASFGFLMDAYKYGAPPHGGMAYGLDRMVMLMLKKDSIRDVIAFPKVQNAGEPMSGAPDVVDAQQLKDLNIALTLKD